ncbi:MAG: aldo/keto reductase [Proteobacteria bacterium]|nr:aldo/keto reductase [Pseudomonadota bacterium]
MSALTISAEPTLLGRSNLRSSPIAYGLWRFAGTDLKTAEEKIEVALNSGITLFDQADVYGVDGGGAFGDSEKLFGDVLRANPSLRAKMVIASKGGIVLGVPYDSSAAYLKQACEASLSRMQIETIDLYQIHRPDFLGHPAEIASALTDLRASGKIREVGVSNYTPSQFRALQAHLDFPIATHQPEFSCLQYSPLKDGILDQCLEYGVTPLAWSPMGGGRLGWSIEQAQAQGEQRVANVLKELDAIAQAQGVSRSAVALAWLMVHPTKVIPIIGTQTCSRILESAQALKVKLTRADWNRILEASMGESLP